MIENVSAFCEWLKAYGMKKELTFIPSDLLERK
jgi:hypothetical protein